jgi:hypothetical protein
MQFDNYRDPTAESVWIKKSSDYNVEVPVDSYYSNLSHYGTGFGTNNFNIYPQQHSDPNLGGGLVKPIIAPYPAEQFPEIMMKLGEPHEYMSAYDKKEIFNCNGYITANQYYNGTKHGSRRIKPLDIQQNIRTPTIAPLNTTMVVSEWKAKAINLVEDFQKGIIKIYDRSKSIYNWIKKYVCPNLSVSVLTELTKNVETILATSATTGMKVEHIAELFFEKCIM